MIKSVKTLTMMTQVLALSSRQGASVADKLDSRNRCPFSALKMSADSTYSKCYMFLFYPNVKIVKEDCMFYICVSKEMGDPRTKELIL